MEEGLAVTDREEAYIESLEKFAGILNEASDKLDDLADSFNKSEEELAEMNADMTDEEIAEQIGEPLVNALDSISTILNGTFEEVIEFTAEQGINNNCESNLINELKLYIIEHFKPISFPKVTTGKDQRKRIRSIGDASDLASGFIKEKRDYISFAFSLDKIREEKGMSPAQLYKAAWLDKRLYSKIMSTPNYRPAKNTAISFGLALRLNLDEFALFLQNAGFALSYSSVFDLVVRFCVEREIYDLHDVNALLLQADQKTLAKEAA
jgi:hypothetical protein